VDFVKTKRRNAFLFLSPSSLKLLVFVVLYSLKKEKVKQC